MFPRKRSRNRTAIRIAAASLRLRSHRIVEVGRSRWASRKAEGGTGRVIPLNDTAIAAMEAHAAWYTRRFGACMPEWFVFAFGSPLPADPTRPITSFKTAWIKVRQKAGVKGRWPDNRHTLVSELAESGAGDEVIMSIAGTFRVPCCLATPTCGWRRSGKLWKRLPRGSARPTRSVRTTLNARSRLRRRLHRRWFSNRRRRNVGRLYLRMAESFVLPAERRWSVSGRGLRAL